MNNHHYTLSRLINRLISRRIALCILAILVFGTSLSVYDAINYVVSLKDSVDKEVEPVADFIVSQIIVNNPDAISTRINEFNKQSDGLKLKFSGSMTDEYRAGNLHISPILFWTYYYPLQADENNQYGVLEVTGSLFHGTGLVYMFFGRIAIILMFSIFLVSFLFPVINKIPKFLIIDPIFDMLDVIKNRKSVFDLTKKSYSVEINTLMSDILKLIRHAEDAAGRTSAWKLSMQVAHDIRSPLAAINIAVSGITDVPENIRTIIRDALGRINDIANNMLNSFKEGSLPDQAESQISPEPVAAILDSIVSEKRCEFHESMTTLILSMSDKVYTCFSSIRSSTFKRVLSNLINNAIEATEGKGDVIISLEHLGHEAQIIVSDNGKGMSPEVLSRAREAGFTHGKRNGNGIGLSSCVEYIEEGGGQLTIDSIEGKGTTVKVTLPTCEPPAWFCDRLTIFPGCTVMILDDDKSIHDAWNQKLSQIAGLRIHAFQDTQYLTHDLIKEINPDVSLVDFELLNDQIDGLEFIKNMHLDNAYLVTACHDNLNMRRECDALRVKIIPKQFMAHLEIIY